MSEALSIDQDLENRWYEKRYKDVSSFMSFIVSHNTGMEVPKETMDTWDRLTLAILVVDEKVDSTKNVGDRFDAYNDIRAYLQGESVRFEKDMELGMESVVSMSEEDGVNKDYFLRLISLLLRVTEEIKTSEDVGHAIKLTLLEGSLTAKLYITLLPQHIKEAAGYKKLASAIKALGVVSNTFDTCVDLPDDYKNGQVSVVPSFYNRLLFFLATLDKSSEVFKNVKITPSIIKKVVWSILATFRAKGRVVA